MIETGTCIATDRRHFALTIVRCLHAINATRSATTVDGFTIGSSRRYFVSVLHTKKRYAAQKGHRSNQEIIGPTQGSVLSTEETPDPGHIVIGMKFTWLTAKTQAVDIRHSSSYFRYVTQF
jgi:hypothetical protein